MAGVVTEDQMGAILRRAKQIQQKQDAVVTSNGVVVAKKATQQAPAREVVEESYYAPEPEVIDFKLSTTSTALPPVTEDQIMDLLSGNRKSARERRYEVPAEPAPRQAQKSLRESTASAMDNKRLINEIRKELRSELKEMIREVIHEEIERIMEDRLTTESVQIKVGKTVFSGNLKPIM